MLKRGASAKPSTRAAIPIIRNIVNDPSVVFDDIVENEYITARAEDIACYYDDLIEYTQYYNLLGEGAQCRRKTRYCVFARVEEKLYLCLMCVNVLKPSVSTFHLPARLLLLSVS